MKKIIIVVGISIFENLPDSSAPSIVTRLSKLSHGQYKKHEKPAHRLLELAKKRKVKNENASAEIKSIISIVKDVKTDVEVCLLATDTILSALACQAIKDWFGNDYQVNDQYKISVQFVPDAHVISDLRIDKQTDYEDGFMNLIEVLNQVYDEDTIFNITAGYKAIVPIMTLYAQLKNIPLKYIYDEGDSKDAAELVTVGSLPFNFDWGWGELFFEFLTKEGLKNISQNSEILSILREQALIKKQEYKLTVLGKMLRNYLTPLVNNRKSNLGYMMEMRSFEMFLENGQAARRGKKIWWYTKSNTHGFSPRFNQEAEQERCIDVDISIQKDTSEIWCEVKSFSETGLKKAETQINFIKEFCATVKAPPTIKEIRLLLYGVGKINNSDDKKKTDRLDAIKDICDEMGVLFNPYYYEIPLSSKGQPNLKKIFESEIVYELLELKNK